VASLVKETAKRASNAAADAAAKPGTRFHDLQHCAVTKLTESGAPRRDNYVFSRFISTQMLEHYSHVPNAAKGKAVDAISSYGLQESRRPNVPESAD
jgi:hypothetical protein